MVSYEILCKILNLKPEVTLLANLSVVSNVLLFCGIFYDVGNRYNILYHIDEFELS